MMLSTPTSTSARAAHAFTLLSLLTAAAMTDASPAVDSLDKRTAGTYVGCFSSSTPLKQINTYMYQSSGYCSGECSSAVMGLTAGNECYCGDQIPAEDDKVDDSECSTKCDGFGQEMCGGTNYWTVYTLQSGATYYGSSDSSSSSSSATPSSSKAPASPASGAATVVTSEISSGHTSVVTITAAADPQAATSTASNSAASKHSGGSSNTAGIAAGVVVGVVVIAAIIGGIFFFLRHKKRKEAEEDYKQRTQVSDFIRGANERKPPGTGYSGYSDQRLDPEAGARRNSVGSLADNQDYSRRILRVANPDSS